MIIKGIDTSQFPGTVTNAPLQAGDRAVWQIHGGIHTGMIVDTFGVGLAHFITEKGTEGVLRTPHAINMGEF